MARNKKLYENEDELVIYENGEERVLCGIFKDGYAVCTDSDTEEEVRVTYPKYSELTGEQIAEIEDITQRPLDAYFDIALVYGEIDGHEPQETGAVC
jgi:TATA-box binding protein (TBP) (component of TFIID and TFIIIB)